MSGSLPKIIDGGLSVDDRGVVSFVNDFDFEGVKRFYMVSNHAKGFVRAWHGHKKESKYALVVSGVAIVCAWDMESDAKDAEIHRYILSAAKPQVLYIPQGHFNGFKTLTEDTRIIFYSTSTLEQSAGDDLRLSADYRREVWEVEER